MSKNDIIFREGLQEYINTIVKPTILAQLYVIADNMVKVINAMFESYPKPVTSTDFYGNLDFPVWTGNLHDSTGVGVYSDGTLKKYIPSVVATITQTSGSTKGIRGVDCLNQALEMGTSRFSKGLWIVLFSSVPYALKVNKEGSPALRGVDFFSKASDSFIYEVFANLEPITNDVLPNNLFLW